MLETILARTRADLAVRRAVRPLDALRRACVPSDRDFVGALRGPRAAFILEHKRASPSEGVIRTGHDPVAIARAYAPFAAAISVLCDAPFFHGGLDDLRAIRTAVSVPVLCKDFVVDPYQVVEARAAGADAILLMLSVLDDDAYRACAAVAHEVGIATLTEVHDEAELTRAIAVGAPVIGINNRDLRTLRIDRETTRRLAPLVPDGRIVVSESGIRHHQDVRELAPFVDAFLIGSSLMRESDIALATRRLCVGMTKVCGLTRPEDAVAAYQAGATHGGVIFAARSPRCVTLEQAATVRAAAPLIGVGVFVDAPPEQILTAVDRLALGAVQLSGDESPAMVRALRAALPPTVEVWKALHVQDTLPDTAAYPVDRILLDTFAPGQHGGTGRRFDWSLLAEHPDRDRIVLAGGISPENVGEAVATGVGAIDVNSGVEQAPGIKDAAKLRHLFLARAA
ncbi:MAG: bifunctional indole-3-glycerol-phosphate synthase TrpC/phosphoribosylanthranilate isomerase TrpF [Gemmatimonadaceae bacterium]